MKVVLVLEDMDYRVKWLRERMPAHVEIRHSDTVEGLLAWWHDDPALVILDHDLGGVPQSLDTGSRDANGHTGMDAALRMPAVSGDVLVWSVNPVRAPQMVALLAARGIAAHWFPFGNRHIAPLIAHALLVEPEPEGES